MKRRARRSALTARRPGQQPAEHAVARAASAGRRRSQPGRCAPASPKYSRRWRVMSAGERKQRQHVDEAEELDLDRLVAHGPFHEPFVPPGRAERHGPAAVQPGEDFPAVGVRQGFQVGRRWSSSVLRSSRFG